MNLVYQLVQNIDDSTAIPPVSLIILPDRTGSTVSELFTTIIERCSSSNSNESEAM